MSAVRVVLITVPSMETARTLARTLVEERLAACVNIVPGLTSIYRFEGAIHEDAELLLVVKTVPHRLTALFARVAELHPYKVPECLALPVESGLPRYLEWVVGETQRVVV
ncbi:MAG: divalent-cation tolerance protein CutA [Deltaproteobacteria bacterium]|nr:divalent-cation tolerance protein CutA [Deltaproteobacteria bacterium]